MNSDMVKPEKFGHLHIVYHFTVPLKVHAFFLFQKSLSNLNCGQYGLIYIVYLESIDQFLSKAHMGKSD